MIKRKLLDLPDKVSYFLLGPRQTGKTTVILDSLEKNRDKITFWHVNLLLSDFFLRYEKDPSQFRRDAEFQINKNKIRCIFIDEVQKIPQLLDEVHQLIETHKIQFILSGSSARKLKRGGANLLGGRAVIRNLFPLLNCELSSEFDLTKVLSIGTLPGIYFEDSSVALDRLKSYAETYLKEEIMEEALVRNLGSFHRFLEVAAQHATEIINFENISRESATKGKVVRGFFQILEDTLIGHQLPAWQESVRKQLALHPKFYFFDNGVMNGILGSIDGTKFPETRGKLFEQWLINEVRALISYSRKSIKMHFWRTAAGNEVDLILSINSVPFACIEFKAKKDIGKKDLSGIKSFSEEYPTIKHKIIVAEVLTASILNEVEILPVTYFLEKKIHEILFT